MRPPPAGPPLQHLSVHQHPCGAVPVALRAQHIGQAQMRLRVKILAVQIIGHTRRMGPRAMPRPTQPSDPVGHRHIAVDPLIAEPIKDQPPHPIPTGPVIAQRPDPRIGQVNHASRTRDLAPEEPMTDPRRLEFDPVLQHRVLDLQIADDIGPHEIHPCPRLEPISQEHIRPDPHRLTGERPPLRRQKAPAVAGQLPGDIGTAKAHLCLRLEPIRQEHIRPDLRRVTVERPPLHHQKASADAGQLPADIGTRETHLCQRLEPIRQEHIRPDPRPITFQRLPLRRQKAPAVAGQLRTNPCSTKVDHGARLKPSAQMHTAARRQSHKIKPNWRSTTGQEQRADPCVPQIGAFGQKAVPKPKIQRCVAPFKVQHPVDPTPFNPHTLWVRAYALDAALAIAAAQHQVADQPGAHAAVGVGGVGGQPLFAGKIGHASQPAFCQQVLFQLAPLIRALHLGDVGPVHRYA